MGPSPSWVAGACSATTHFPLDNLPYGVFSHRGEEPRCGVAIGDRIVDARALERRGLLRPADTSVLEAPAWNTLMAAGPTAWRRLRQRLTELLAADGDPVLRDDAALQEAVLPPLASARLHLPFVVAEFTDFYAGRRHATNVGTIFRGPENALPPNWLHTPIGYNGRASTVVVSGTEIRRPLGQLKAPGDEAPRFGPTERLDFELEIGAVVGTASSIGQPISVAEADAMIFGYVLLNDWSARDIQAWEYQPLGPFQAKAFATSISPWIVTAEALSPFRRETPPPEKELLPYLRPTAPGLYDISLEVRLRPAGGTSATSIARTGVEELYFSPAQQLCHHAVSGCAMRVGDLLGSGTISGPERENRGSLLEISWGGSEPLVLPDGQQRSFLEDGDEVTLTGFAAGDGYRVGFGECTGRILSALDRDDWPR